MQCQREIAVENVLCGYIAVISTGRGNISDRLLDESGSAPGMLNATIKRFLVFRCALSL